MQPVLEIRSRYNLSSSACIGVGISTHRHRHASASAYIDMHPQPSLNHHANFRHHLFARWMHRHNGLWFIPKFAECHHPVRASVVKWQCARQPIQYTTRPVAHRCFGLMNAQHLTIRSSVIGTN